MSLPRRILPGQIWLATRRCVQRMFLLTPDETTNAVILYCLAEAAQRFSIGVIMFSAQSNHHHTAFYDPYGNVIEFIEHFHKLVAKAVNAHRGRWENLWSTEEPSLVEITSEADLLDKVVYVATNPVKHGLVKSVADWPGINALADVLARRSVTVQRPTHFFRADGPMPAEVEITFGLPEGLVADPDAFLATLEERVSATEKAYAEDRARTGHHVIGARRILRQSWRDSPTSHEPRRGIRPRVAARTIWRRIQLLQRNKEFQAAYQVARKLWLAGFEVVFPAGTYWLRRFAAVVVEAYEAATVSTTPAAILD